MSGFSNFAISFSIICILAGGVTSLQLGVSAVGGAAAGLVWPAGVAFSLVVALAMAQIASAFPTAGGLYHWSSILAGRGWGWVTAWLNLGGLIFLAAAVNVGAYTLFAGFLAPMLGIDPARLTDVHKLAGVGAHHAVAGADQPLRHPADQPAHRLQRLPDPGGHRAADRRHALAPSPPRRRATGRVHRQRRRRGRRRLAGGARAAGHVPAGADVADLHHHWLRRLGAHVRGDRARLAQRAARDPSFGAGLGHRRLDHGGVIRAGDARSARGGAAGRQRLPLADGAGLPRRARQPALDRDRRRELPVRPRQHHLDLAHDLRVRARRRPAAVVGAEARVAAPPGAGRRDLGRRRAHAGVDALCAGLRDARPAPA